MALKRYTFGGLAGIHKRLGQHTHHLALEAVLRQHFHKSLREHVACCPLGVCTANVQRNCV